MPAALPALPAAMVPERDVVRGVAEAHLGSLSRKESLNVLGFGGVPAQKPVLAQVEQVTYLGPGVLIGGAQGGV